MKIKSPVLVVSAVTAAVLPLAVEVAVPPPAGAVSEYNGSCVTSEGAVGRVRIFYQYSSTIGGTEVTSWSFKAETGKTTAFHVDVSQYRDRNTTDHLPGIWYNWGNQPLSGTWNSNSNGYWVGNGYGEPYGLVNPNRTQYYGYAFTFYIDGQGSCFVQATP